MLIFLIWFGFSLVFAFVAMFFTVDAVFHEVLPNEFGAIVVAVSSSTALAGLVYLVNRSGARPKRTIVFVTGLALLVLQPFAQQAVRTTTRNSVDASWENVKTGIVITAFHDELLVTKSGQPIGVQVSFDFTTAQGVELMMFPHLKTETTPPVFFEPGAFQRQPGVGQDGHWYEPNKSYRVTYDLLPSTLTRDPATGLICFRFSSPDSLERLKEAGQSARSGQLVIVMDGVLFAGTSKSLRVQAKTQKQYDLTAFAQTAKDGDIQKCSAAVTNTLYRTAPP